ncbi:hypothetical protein PSACC_00869 [Paramicrosporidium saccamoebae]|uniref:KN17 SH3-like domain-containing protein n=1 Tax=Paramicrosporidium saccamoebae TaxID=1246581 RepID=A0A2H9TNL6_9FUNG|nr:hypothetical protein PSACC_00869 [Paramicrosporidium saccamoebae]
MSEVPRKTLSIAFNKGTTKTARPTAEQFLQDEKPEPVHKVVSEEELEDIPWLQVGLVVRIENRKLADGKYHGKTGIIRRIIEQFGAEVHVEGGDILQLDQDDCSAMLPPIGQDGLVVLGEYKDTRVKVIRVEKDVEVELCEGRKSGHMVILPTLHVCKHIAIKST